MDRIKFEWDPEKNRINQQKHQISFEEALAVFYDDDAKVIDDPDHSTEEERFLILGMSSKAKLLVVCHCYRSSETVIRIISARKATNTETKQYFDEEEAFMRDEYDFSSARKNPYTKKLKKQITINIDSDTIDFFKKMAVDRRIPYQTLINLYLSDCAAHNRQIDFGWNEQIRCVPEQAVQK